MSIINFSVIRFELGRIDTSNVESCRVEHVSNMIFLFSMYFVEYVVYQFAMLYCACVSVFVSLQHRA